MLNVFYVLASIVVAQNVDWWSHLLLRGHVRSQAGQNLQVLDPSVIAIWEEIIAFCVFVCWGCLYAFSPLSLHCKIFSSLCLDLGSHWKSLSRYLSGLFSLSVARVLSWSLYSGADRDVRKASLSLSVCVRDVRLQEWNFTNTFNLV